MLSGHVETERSEYKLNFQNGSNGSNQLELCAALMMQTYALKNENQDTVDAQFTWMTQELTWKVPF